MTACMKMPGGGTFEVGPGQVTDDSEMAMCLMWALVEANEGKAGSFLERELNSDLIAKWYANWIKSVPFDIGNSTINGLRPLEEANTIPKAWMSKQSAAEKNEHSQSNGSLMRCTPMAVWTSSLYQDSNYV